VLYAACCNFIQQVRGVCGLERISSLLPMQNWGVVPYSILPEGWLVFTVTMNTHSVPLVKSLRSLRAVVVAMAALSLTSCSDVFKTISSAFAPTTTASSFQKQLCFDFLIDLSFNEGRTTNNQKSRFQLVRDFLVQSYLPRDQTGLLQSGDSGMVYPIMPGNMPDPNGNSSNLSPQLPTQLK
jgi:hypothetical protein